MRHKYVRHVRHGFIVWPATPSAPWHLDIADAIPGDIADAIPGDRAGIVSAGFADIANGLVRCYGRSDTLGIGSQPQDTQELAKQLSLRAAPMRQARATLRAPKIAK